MGGSDYRPELQEYDPAEASVGTIHRDPGQFFSQQDWNFTDYEDDNDVFYKDGDFVPELDGGLNVDVVAYVQA